MMKKRLLLISVAIALTSCSILEPYSNSSVSSSFISSSQNSESIISSTITSSEELTSSLVEVSSSSLLTSEISIPPVNKNIILTEMNTGTTYSDRAIEISNIGEEDVALNHYAINVYRNWSDIPTETIALDGYVINAKSCFVIAYSEAKKEIKDKANLITAKYLNDGTYPVSLSFYGQVVDTIGEIGNIYDFAKAAVLVRLKEYFTQYKKFKEYRWIRYPINTLETLGNYDVISEEDLLDGPKLTDEFFNKPFCDNATNGNGGVLEVSYLYNIDGDTTRFNYGSDYDEYEISGSLSTRYYGVNTPEIAHSDDEEPDPYGDEAKAFTQRMLNSAKHYIVQSVNGYSLHETYGRMLCYIWITNKENPEISDYQLLNFLIVKNGFSRPGFIDRKASYNSLMTYQGISYVEYLYYANTYAELLGLNIHSK